MKDDYPYDYAEVFGEEHDSGKCRMFWAILFATTFSFAVICAAFGYWLAGGWT